jgi:hypothetical protein
MVTTSVANPFRIPFPMVQIEMGKLLSLSLSAKNWAGCKRAVPFGICPVFGLVSALRSLSSVALSSARVPPVYHSPLFFTDDGDISTLQNRGHFYFALTGSLSGYNYL